ncbi:MAG: hypothetical protein ABR540_00865 [Acidimicrobiales bacterium]
MSYTEGQLDAFANWERHVWATHATPYAKNIASLTRGAADALLDAAEVRAGSRCST